jgi:hypothetical protein
MQAETRVIKLERKVNALSKALDLLLFEEPEELSKEESDELKERLSDYLRGKKDMFVPLEEPLKDV